MNESGPGIKTFMPEYDISEINPPRVGGKDPAPAIDDRKGDHPPRLRVDRRSFEAGSPPGSLDPTAVIVRSFGTTV